MVHASIHPGVTHRDRQDQHEDPCDRTEHRGPQAARRQDDDGPVEHQRRSGVSGGKAEGVRNRADRLDVRPRSTHREVHRQEGGQFERQPQCNEQQVPIAATYDQHQLDENCTDEDGHGFGRSREELCDLVPARAPMFCNDNVQVLIPVANTVEEAEVDQRGTEADQDRCQGCEPDQRHDDRRPSLAADPTSSPAGGGFHRFGRESIERLVEHRFPVVLRRPIVRGADRARRVRGSSPTPTYSCPLTYPHPIRGMPNPFLDRSAWQGRSGTDGGSMVVILVVVGVAVGSGLAAYALACRWPDATEAPRIRTTTIVEAVEGKPRLTALFRRRFDPAALTGLALTGAVTIIFVAAIGVGALLTMVRTDTGFAEWDASFAAFGADNAHDCINDVPSQPHPPRGVRGCPRHRCAARRRRVAPHANSCVDRVRRAVAGRTVRGGRAGQGNRRTRTTRRAPPHRLLRIVVPIRARDSGRNHVPDHRLPRRSPSDDEHQGVAGWCRHRDGMRNRDDARVPGCALVHGRGCRPARRVGVVRVCAPSPLAVDCFASVCRSNRPRPQSRQ